MKLQHRARVVPVPTTLLAATVGWPPYQCPHQSPRAGRAESSAAYQSILVRGAIIGSTVSHAAPVAVMDLENSSRCTVGDHPTGQEQKANMNSKSRCNRIKLDGTTSEDRRSG